MTDNQIIQIISERKESLVLHKLYKYSSKIVSFIKSRGGSKEDAEDIFQEALVVLCHNVWKGNFELTSSLYTYLYSVSYNLWRNKERSEKTESVPDGLVLIDISSIEEVQEKESKLKKVEEILLKLGEPCLKLLKMFYHQQLKMKEIAEELGYKTVNSAKVQKYKCLERAKSKL